MTATTQARALIVTAHPDPGSLTADIARQLQEALPCVDVDIADLTAEGFDPRFRLDDRYAYRGRSAVPEDVRREQRRLDGVEHLVLVFPVYWWSMPALLKGWIDRVFINGWAFDIDPVAGTRRNLHTMIVHLILVAGDTAATYERHGYEQALITQIEHGIVDYWGATRGSTAFVYESEQDGDQLRRAHAADAVARTVQQIRLER